jgi:hypothetical protein
MCCHNLVRHASPSKPNGGHAIRPASQRLNDHLLAHRREEKQLKDRSTVYGITPSLRPARSAGYVWCRPNS